MSEFQFGVEKVTTYNADDFVNINKPGEYLHRILAGGSTIESVFYPTIVFDEDEQALKQIWKVLKKDAENGSPILDWLAKTDLMIRKQNSSQENKNIRSQFAGSKKWIYLIFDRTSPIMSLKVAQYPFSVAKELSDLEGKLDTNDPTMLRYGPTLSWDAIITHKYDEHKKCVEWQKHSYGVEVDPNSRFNGKFPARILDTTKYPNPINALDEDGKKVMFNEEEWKAINNSKIKMGDILKPNTEEEIIEALTGKFPIYLGATRNDAPVFPNKEQFLAEMENNGYKAMISTTDLQPKLPPVITGEDEPEKTIDKISLTKVEEADVISTKKETLIELTDSQKAKINITKTKEENKLVKTEEEVDNSVLSSLQKELKKNSKKNEQVDVKVKVEPETKEEKSTTEDLTLNFK